MGIMSITESIVKGIIEVAIENIPTDKVKGAIDKMIDKAEDAVEASPTKIDDIIVLPLLKKVRETFDIEDNDEKE